jgi:hypothetical protein
MTVNPQLRPVKQSEKAFTVVEDFDFVDSRVKHSFKICGVDNSFVLLCHTQNMNGHDNRNY